MKVDFADWSDTNELNIAGNKLQLVSLSTGKESVAKNNVVNNLPFQYRSKEKIIDSFRRFGRHGVVKLLEVKLPTYIHLRSAELGEILATEYVDECTEFKTPVKKLRWKDHRNMPLRGEDVIGVRLNGDGKIEFLKVEAKSRKKLDTRTVKEARKTLLSDNGLPSVTGMTYISERLFELGNSDLSTAIEKICVYRSILASSVTNMIFTFSGNAPDQFLKNDLIEYESVCIDKNIVPVKQKSVGLRINDHQEFITDVFEKVLEVETKENGH